MTPANDLHQLKNLGAVSVGWLNACGIGSVQQLAELGAVRAYLRVKRAGYQPSLNLLYALAGALTNTHWNRLDPAERHRLVLEANAIEDAQQN